VRAPIRRAPRRSRVWARRRIQVDPAPNAGTALDLLVDWKTEMAIAANFPGITVGGVLLDLAFTQTNARASSDDGVLLGMGVFAESTSTEVDRPDAARHADWMWYQWIPAPGAAAGASFSTFSSAGGPIRIRSRRKMQELDQRLWLVVQGIGLTTIDVTVSSSVLLLMP
jgi:hypothetical protein